MNFTESDGQTLMLCNRHNWQIHEENKNSIEELNAYVFNDSSSEEQEQAEENARVIDKLVTFCIRNWDNGFMRGVKEQMKEQMKSLEG